MIQLINKEQKVNWIKCWLQKFGDRNNETFYTKVTLDKTDFELSLQYDFDFEGDRIEPYDSCVSSFKQLRNIQISDRTDEELDKIIKQLELKQLYY